MIFKWLPLVSYDWQLMKWMIPSFYERSCSAGLLEAPREEVACGPQGRGAVSLVALQWEDCSAPFPLDLDVWRDAPICSLMGLGVVGQLFCPLLPGNEPGCPADML